MESPKPLNISVLAESKCLYYIGDTCSETSQENKKQEKTYKS